MKPEEYKGFKIIMKKEAIVGGGIYTVFAENKEGTTFTKKGLATNKLEVLNGVKNEIDKFLLKTKNELYKVETKGYGVLILANTRWSDYHSEYDTTNVTSVENKAIKIENRLKSISRDIVIDDNEWYVDTAGSSSEENFLGIRFHSRGFSLTEKQVMQIIKLVGADTPTPNMEIIGKISGENNKFSNWDDFN